jgi:hypothetical protein
MVSREWRIDFQHCLIKLSGLDWDILYVGTCYNIPRDPHPAHVTYKDPNAPSEANVSAAFVDELHGWGVKTSKDPRRRVQRVLAPSWYPICTIGYAVTQRGAQRLLYHVGGVVPFGSAIDLTLTDRIKEGLLRSFTVIPPLITPWKTGGVKDSDIDDMKAKEAELKEGDKLDVGSQNLWKSARLSMSEVFGNQSSY